MTQQLYCTMRKTWIAATPEELVRQNILQHLIHQLNFPSSCIVVEKEFKLLPHLQLGQELPERRVDILCYAKIGEKMHPLLLIECKAVPISSKEFRQVISYNRSIQASFIALVNQNEQKLGWIDSQQFDYQYVNYIPSYADLLKSLSFE